MLLQHPFRYHLLPRLSHVIISPLYTSKILQSLPIMVQYIITPWRSQSELLRIRHHLYPNFHQRQDVESRRNAVARVMIWVQRGNCPHLVESTAILISAMLNDVPGNSTYCVRAAYAAAFCRFVTGLLDSHQDKKRKLSMYSIAKTLGLPATYVELRHQATHEELPSLSKLRTATHKALQWIWDYYWARLPSESASEPMSESAHLRSIAETTYTADTCRAFVKKLLRENDEEERMKVEKGLEEWNQDEILDVLMEMQNSESDIKIILRATQLQQRLLSSDDHAEDNASGEMQMDSKRFRHHNVYDAAKGKGLGGSHANEAIIDHALGEPVVQGWKRWEGPWIPKPIGVV